MGPHFVLGTPTLPGGTIPHFEAGEGVLHGALVVLHHVGVHVGVVAADVPLGAAVGDRAEAEWGVLLLRLLELRGAPGGSVTGGHIPAVSPLCPQHLSPANSPSSRTRTTTKPLKGSPPG